MLFLCYPRRHNRIIEGHFKETRCTLLCKYMMFEEDDLNVKYLIEYRKSFLNNIQCEAIRSEQFENGHFS